MKNYILDTNVLLHDPNCILSFEENTVLIPIEVIEEIDRFKRESTERGANARTISRTLDGLRIQGRLSEGVGLPNGGRLRIVFQSANGHGQIAGGGGTDKFRMKIWNKTTGQPVYDNMLGASDDAVATTVIGAGSIVIHAK